MTINVTVIGAGGVTVTIPVNSAAVAALAQTALNTVSNLVTASSLTQVTYAPGTALPTFEGLGGVVASVGGIFAQPANYVSAVATGVNTIGIVGDTAANPTVVGGAQTNLTYINNAANASVFFSGPNNGFAENTAASSAHIRVDSAAALGGVATYIDGSKGATTIDTYANSLVNVVAGGANLIRTQTGGTSYIEVSGSSTVPVSVAGGGAGSNIWYVPSGGNGFINPGAGNVVITPGIGSTTLFGGAAPISGAGYDTDTFSGAATVLGGVGYFQGGLAGNNLLTSTTTAGVTTLIGAGNNDYLMNYGAKNTLIAGAGNETLASSTNPNDPNGAIFGTGTGNTTVFADLGGGNSIFMNSGNAALYGNHGVNGTNGNFYTFVAGGGTDSIADFLPGIDHVMLSTSVGAPVVQSSTYYATAGASPFGVAGTQTTLSNGSTIDFLNVNATARSNFT